jgi:hypothetical protein
VLLAVRSELHDGHRDLMFTAGAAGAAFYLRHCLAAVVGDDNPLTGHSRRGRGRSDQDARFMIFTGILRVTEI